MNYTDISSLTQKNVSYKAGCKQEPLKAAKSAPKRHTVNYWTQECDLLDMNDNM